MFSKKYIVSMLVMVYFLSALVFSSKIDNVLQCDFFPKDKVPSGYYPLIGVMSSYKDADGNVMNGHLSDLSSNKYNYVIACNTKGYAELEGKVLDVGKTCEKNHYAYVINMSGKTNAHVKSPYSTSNDAYLNEFCINLKKVVEGVGGYLYCDVRDHDCRAGETCLFKLVGSIPSIEDSNAHVYECGTSSLSNYKSVCCKLMLNPEGEIVVDVKSVRKKEVFLQVGMYSQMLVTLFNPSQEPKRITLRLDSTNDNNGKIFKNFIWFDNKGVPSREQTVTLRPYERDYIVVNIFGGKVGKYNLIINKEENGEESTLYTANVTVLPANIKGVKAQSPEFGQVYVFIMLLVSVGLLYRTIQ